MDGAEIISVISGGTSGFIGAGDDDVDVAAFGLRLKANLDFGAADIRRFSNAFSNSLSPFAKQPPTYKIASYMNLTGMTYRFTPTLIITG